MLGNDCAGPIEAGAGGVGLAAGDSGDSDAADGSASSSRLPHCKQWGPPLSLLKPHSPQTVTTPRR
ncbi:hypothetical protein GCM10010399_71590 [Dactylosporangium fulvum]